MGPFQYVAGSQPGGPYADAWGWQPLGQNYPTEEELEARIPASARCRRSPARRARSSSATPRASTAAGSRRRSRACSRPRRTRRPASLAALTVRSYTYAGALDELDEPTRFALT